MSEAEHKGQYKSGGYMIDRWECSCGWVSPPYFDGDAWAEDDWKKHVAKVAEAPTPPTVAEGE